MHLGHRWKVGAVLASLVVTAACSGGGSATPSAGSSPSGSPAAREEKPKAAPTWIGTDGQEIRIGERRYVSPCQVLTPRDASVAVGGFSGRDNIEEEYVDSSKPKDGRAYPTRCEYLLVRGLLDVWTLSVEAEQVADRPKPSEALLVDDFVAAREELEPVVARLEQVVTADPGRQLVAQMRASLELLPDELDVPVTEEQVASLVLPDRWATSGVVVRQGDTEWTVEYRGGDAYGFEKLTDDDLRERADVLARAVESVRAHLADPELSQEPAPTYLTTTTHRGPSPVLEPCAILTDEAFGKILHGTPNVTVERASAAVDLEASPRGVDGITILPWNSCKRTHDSGIGPLDESKQTSIEISVSYAADLAELKRDGRLESKFAHRKLRTRADWARVSLVLGSLSYVFRVGPYFVILDVSRLDREAGIGDIDTVDGSKRDHVRAINVLSDALRAAIDRSTTLLAD